VFELIGRDKICGVDLREWGWALSARRSLYEALWVGFVGVIEGSLTHSEHGVDVSEKDVGGRVQGEAHVMMILVIPIVVVVAPCIGLTEAFEAFGKVWLVLQGFELTLDMRVITGNSRATVGHGHT